MHNYNWFKNFVLKTKKFIVDESLTSTDISLGTKFILISVFWDHLHYYNFFINYSIAKWLEDNKKKSQLLKNKITFKGYRFSFVQLFSEYFLYDYYYLHLQWQK